MANTAKLGLTVPAVNTQTAKQRSKTQANSPKLPITRTNHRPLRQTCHSGVHYTHKSQYLLMLYLLISSRVCVCVCSRLCGPF